MPVKMSFRGSKPRNGRVGVGRGRTSGNDGENMNSNDGRRVRIKKDRSFGNGDEDMSSKDKGGCRSIKIQNSRTERRESSSRNFEFGEEIRDSKPRRGRASIGEGRSFGNGYENMNSKNRGRINIGRSSGNGNRNLNLKDQQGRKSVKGHSSRTERRVLSNRDEQEEFENEEEIKVRGAKKVLKSRGKDESKDMRNEGFQTENVSQKRKRVYANESLGNIETTNGKSMLKFARKEVRILKEKRMGKDAESLLAGRKKYGGSEVEEKKRGKTTVEDEGLNGTYKREGKEKSVTRKKLITSSAENRKKSANKKVGTKKVVGNDNAEEADQPKKKKRMRIDPYDFSNKRMDDCFIAKDGEEKKDLPKSSNDAELSLNAQFRAICPSQSILSYVEDNLLGRRREIEIKRAGYNIDLSYPLDNIPLSTCSERERIEEPAFRNKLEFFAAAKQSASFPPFELPEIAFAGRSNVGKSSMLNALTRQWGVVRTSDKPGLTQSINFFKLGSKLCLVDLPGYGFAYAKEEAKEAWEELVKEYVSTRVGLKRVCLLVDTKWGMKQRDYELVDLMERSKTKYQIVLTKTDLVFPIDVARRAMQIEESLKGKKSAVQPAMMVSSKSGAGIRSFRTALSKIARFIKP